MTDYISREAVLSFPFANGQYDREHADEHFIYGCESYREWIEQLPAADAVEVRHGRWIWELADNGWANHICSECGYTKNTDIHVRLGYNYCPNCGAKMDGGQDE